MCTCGFYFRYYRFEMFPVASFIQVPVSQDHLPLIYSSIRKGIENGSVLKHDVSDAVLKHSWVQLHSAWNIAESNSTVETQLSPTPQCLKHSWVQLHSDWNTAESNSTVIETQLSPTPQCLKHSRVQLHSVWNTAESNFTVFETFKTHLRRV